MMQGVLLAAGESTRTRPLTNLRPKPLLPLCGRPIIEHTLSGIAPLVEEVIIVVGFGADVLIFHLGEEFLGLPLRYVHQERRLGSGDALLQAAGLIKGDFLLAAGDDYYPRDDFSAVSSKRHAVVARRVKDAQRFGVIEAKDGVLIEFEEKPAKPKSELANSSLYHLDRGFLPLVEALSESESGEIELTRALKPYSEKVRLSVVESAGWMAIGYPWDLLTASEALGGGDERGWIDESAQLHPQARVHNSIIMARASVGAKAHLANSIIAPGAVVEAGVKVEDKPLPGEKTVFSTVKGRAVDTLRERFGCVLGDRAQVGEEAMLACGVKIWPGVYIPPGVMVNDDVMENTIQG